jgi:hypothetical protein
MTKKGKSRTRKARADIMRANAANARRKAKSYDRTRYDGGQAQETPLGV